MQVQDQIKEAKKMSAKIPENPFILVDGSSYLFRAFHALPPLVTSKGQPTGAIFGVINMLRKLMAEYSPEKMAVIFDSKEKNFRHKLYPAYKANRTIMPDDLQKQIQPLFELIEAMGLPLIVVPGVEADDIIGTLAKQAQAQGLFTLISTGDKDFAQIVNDKIYLINTMSQDILDRNRVIEKFEVPPERIIDYLTLIGDSVDNIKGVPNVGPKTAVKWLQTYNTLDEILVQSEAIPGKVGENLRAMKDQLPLFRSLLTIDQNISLDQKIADLKLKEKNFEKLKHLFAELEFKSWLKDLLEHPDLKAKGTSAEEEQLAEAQGSSKKAAAKKQCQIIFSDKDLKQLLKLLKNAKEFAFKCFINEDTSWRAKLIGLAFVLEDDGCFYLPLAHDYPTAAKQLNLAATLQALKPIFEDASILKIGHHIKNDAEILANYDIKLEGFAFDTMLESYILDSAGTRHDIPTLAERALNREAASYEVLAGKGAKQLEFNHIEIEKAAEYAADQVDIILCLHSRLWKTLGQNESLHKMFKDIEMPLVPVLTEMELTGVLVDIKRLKKHSIELEKKCQALENEVHTIAGEAFNLNSPKQLQEILFTKLKLPILEKTPTGQPSTAESVMQALAEKYPLPNKILEYRSLSKLKSTYTDKLPEQVNPKTGRIHTSYQQAVTSTGRLSSIDPNLQNIPIRTEEGRKIRAAFIAEKGYKIVTADYSQIELRLMAHMAQDEVLIEAFNKENDIHQRTAASIFNVSMDKVTKDQRRSAKVINFGLIYGMSTFGLSKQLGIDRESAELYIQNYFASFPRVKVFIDEILKQAKAQGYVETLFGRRLYLPDLNSQHIGRKRAAERAAINAPMQGTNADIIKLAMIELHQWLKGTNDKARMIMQVHDELVFEVEESFLDKALPKIKSVMENVLKLSVPLKVDIGVGNNWDEAQEEK